MGLTRPWQVPGACPCHWRVVWGHAACALLHGVARPRWLCGRSRRALACVRWSSCFPASQRNPKKQNLASAGGAGMRHAGKHSWSGRRQRPERAAWPSRPERFCLFHTALLGLRCWIWGFPWKTGRVCLVCVGFFSFPPSFFWSWVNCHCCCESRLASRPKLASLGQLKAAINLHFFGKGTPCPEAAFALEVLGSGPGFDGEVPQGW